MQERHAIADALDRWNRRGDTVDNDRMRCATPGHGLLVATDDPASGNGVRWQCPHCRRTHPVREQQVTFALGAEHLPDIAAARHDDEVRMPDGMRGDRGDGSIRIRSTPIPGGPEVSGLGLLFATLGFTGGVCYGVSDMLARTRDYQTPVPHALFGPLIIAMLVGLGAGLVLGELASSLLFPASRIERSTMRRAERLQPGDWVASQPGTEHRDRASRVVQVTGLPLNSPCYPGVRVTLLTGDTVACAPDEQWRVLTLR